MSRSQRCFTVGTHIISTLQYITTLFTLTALTLIAVTPLPASAEILDFQLGALPNCAYSCTPLYNAQFDCKDKETAAGECFCNTKYVAPLLNGKDSVCDDVCPEGNGGEKVKAWFEKVCSKYMKSQEKPEEPPKDPQNPPQGPDEPPLETPKNNGGTTNSTDNDNVDKDPLSHGTSTKAIDWWRANWHWFLVAFLVITVPILVYALWFPCRKWARRQIIARRARRPLPPLDPAAIEQLYANGGLPSPGLIAPIPPVPGFMDERWRDPISPSLTREGMGHFPKYRDDDSLSVPSYGHGHGSSSGMGSRAGSVDPVGMPLNGSTMGVMTSQDVVRQHSWERRVREEYEGKKTMGERLSFWRRSKSPSGEDEEVKPGPGVL